MHQTKKGKQWYFGMKVHVGVDSKTKIIHTAVATAANVADSSVLPDLLHGEETRVCGDQAYRGQIQVIRECAPQAQDCTHRRYRYKGRIDEVERAKNRTKSTVRSQVEHVFGVMKLKFGFVKLRYRGLEKNATQLFAVCALVNLYLVRKRLLLLAPGLAWERRLLITGEPPKWAGRPERTESERLHQLGRTLTTSKTRAYSEFP